MTTIGARHRSLRDETVDELRRLILSGELEPGTHLTELAISERLGVSRLPVREAFRRLEAEGLLEALPRRGVRVVQLDGDELETVREIRVALELMAVRRTVERGDTEVLADLHRMLGAGNEQITDSARLDELNDEFHELLSRGSGSRFLADTLRAVRNQAHHLVGGKSAAVGHSWEEHARIIEAVLARDAEFATLLMRRHLTARHENQGGTRGETAPSPASEPSS
ncbi:GntR family transcriptional regulator [Kineosporia sp. J2-2]|uniref:GntR family transcriptional regulator n=1 Tax=Kineosporia corallincola TaxID=2835133 RepID=A0ABS5TAL3_9ACTN|nr:GntR family transcriptional regulator [Kineosporia corallincola]MBT0768100.1 GntR family transcriptional regulator [Kineosporia corallincola]